MGRDPAYLLWELGERFSDLGELSLDLLLLAYGFEVGDEGVGVLHADFALARVGSSAKLITSVTFIWWSLDYGRVS